MAIIRFTDAHSQPPTSWVKEVPQGIAAFVNPKGRHAAVWNAAVDGRYELVVSPAIIREMAKVLRRDFGWREDRVQMAIRVVAQNARVVVPHSVLSVVTADPDDDRILECALDGKADIIVSNDHHLLDLRTYAAIPIVAGVDFRRTLGLK